MESKFLNKQISRSTLFVWQTAVLLQSQRWNVSTFYSYPWQYLPCLHLWCNCKSLSRSEPHSPWMTMLCVSSPTSGASAPPSPHQRLDSGAELMSEEFRKLCTVWSNCSGVSRVMVPKWVGEGVHVLSVYVCVHLCVCFCVCVCVCVVLPQNSRMKISVSRSL